MYFQALIAVLALIVALLAFYRAFKDHLTLQKENKQLDSELNELRRVLKYRGNLASEIAHEIKNPITAILCSAETLDLLMADKLDANQKQSLGYIREFGDNLLKLVSDFLDVSRAEAGNIQSQPKKVDLASVTESVIGLLEASAARKGVKFTNSIESKDMHVYADPVHLKQILFNLLHNAVKFSNKGGEISVRGTKAAEEDKVLVSVEDNGIGIPNERLGELFDPYVKYETRQSAVIDTRNAGVGLGLALCKSLVELAGGKILVRSVVGQGSIFSFTLPSVEETPRFSTVQEPVSIASLQEKPLSGKNFLLVHKNESAGDAVMKLIEAWGGAVKHVEEAKDALKAVAEQNYDAVLLDNSIEENERSGMLESINSNNPKANLICTGFQVQKGLKSTAIDKPFNSKLLLRTLLQ